MDTDSIYSKLNMTYDKYLEILEKNKDLFGKDVGQIEPESINNPIQEGVFLSSKSYSYICKNDIPKFEFEGKRKDTSLVIMRSFQYFCEYRRQL